MKMPQSVGSARRLTSIRAWLGLWVIFFAQTALFSHAQEPPQIEDAPTYLAKAQEDRRMGRSGPAVLHYYRALYYDPANPEASKELSELLIGQKRYEEAQTVLDAALKLTPNEPDLWANLGLAAEKRGDHAKAQDAYQRAADMARDDPFIQISAAAYYQSRGNQTKAEAFSQRAQEAEAITNQGTTVDDASE